MCQAHTCATVAKCWPRPKFKFSKTVEVGWLCKKLYNSVRARLPLTKSKKKKIIESTAI